MSLSETRIGLAESNPSGKFSTLPPPPQRWESFLAPEVPNVSNKTELKALSTPEYLTHILRLAVEVIESPNYRDPETGYISDTAWKKLVDGGLLAASLGDRDPLARQEEIMHVGRMLSYYDISLGLTYGITTALAIMPLQRFGTEEQKNIYLTKIRNGARMALAITEQDKSGSTAIIMDSKYTKNDDGTSNLHITKKWQGLSGMGDVIVALRNKDAPEDKPTIGFFIVNKEDINTEIIDMNVLSGIPYGINTADVTLSTKDHLMAELSFKGLLVFKDLFTKSRLLFVGMTLGHQERTEYEAQNYAYIRVIGNTLQADMEIPSYHLDNIRARSVILEAIFNRVAEYRKNGMSLLNANTISFDTEAAIIKVLSAEFAYTSASERVILAGANAYLRDSAQQHADDIEPFRTFEGAEDMLYQQIGSDLLRKGGISDMWTVRNLNRRSLNIIEEIARFGKVTKVHEKIVGEIASRVFALGCIDQYSLDTADFKNAKKMLNLQIRQLSDELFLLDKDD